MFDEIKDSLKYFEATSQKKLADYKDLIEDIKTSVEICSEELNSQSTDEFSKSIINQYRERYLPANPYERARVMLRRLKSDKAKLDKFITMNKGKDKKYYVFVGITKDELINIKKDIKFLDNLFSTDLKDYEIPYSKIFKEGLSLSEYSKSYLDGKKKTAENLVNKIYRMVAQMIKIESQLFSYKTALPIFKSKRNKRLAEMEEEVVSNVLLNLVESDKPDSYFENMKNAYIELCEAKQHVDENGNFN